MKNIPAKPFILLSAIFFLGWVLPAIPFIRRISVDKAEDLWVEYAQIVAKPNQDIGDVARTNTIALQLNKAGYAIVSGDKGIQVLLYPDYAK